jgi:hypothetical protein
MNKNSLNFLLAVMLSIAFTFPGKVGAQEHAGSPDFYSGHYSRDGNSESPSSASGNNIYIKFFEGQWIATLFVPYPYATTVEPAVITKALENAKKQTATSAYIRGDFGHLEESATAQIERFGYLDNQIVYECGSLAPCTIKLEDGFLEQIKPGVINEHIIRYNHVTSQ